MSSKTFPSLNSESELFASGARFVLGIDEVGRGSIAGPVAVGVSLITANHLGEPTWPAELRDSKLLSEPTRERIFEPVGQWVAGWAVGMASAAEIDERGIVWSLATAASRALNQLVGKFEPAATVAILDGSHNWLKEMPFAVRVQTKADRDCVSVAAASVLAKVTRDRLMIELDAEYSGYGLAGHKGYASAAHMDAVRALGPSPLHRVTWLGGILAGGNSADPSVDGEA
ncbi:MAG: ribonuclease HII [Micrococcales bacterium]